MSKPVFQDLFTFSGRRNRKSYIGFVVMTFVVLLVIGISMVQLTPSLPSNQDVVIYPGVFALFLLLPLMVAGWAVAAQRCRDFGWTGWAALILLIPYIGQFFAIALMVIPSTIGANRYGPDPLNQDRDRDDLLTGP